MNMETLVLIVLGALLLVVAIVHVGNFASFLFCFIAPDKADEREIKRQLGQDTPATRRALARRFGPRSYLRDAMTGLGGLAGMIWLYWFWFH